MMLIQVNIE